MMFRLIARHTRRLHDDRSGQSLILLVFVLSLLVVFTATIINTGAHVSVRQEMQTAADAAAYSGAAVKAKAMNIIALTNQAMVSIMAMIVVAKFVKYTLAIVHYGLMGACAFLNPAACFAAGLVGQARSMMDPFINGIISFLERVMTLLEAIATAVAALAPAWAIITVHRIARKNGADVGIGLPERWALPSKKVAREYLCDRVAEQARDFARDIPIIGNAPLIGGIIQRAVGGISSIICNGAGSFELTPEEDGEAPPQGSTDCNVCKSKNNLTQTAWTLEGGTIRRDTYVEIDGTPQLQSTDMDSLQAGALMSLPGRGMLDQVDTTCTNQIARDQTATTQGPSPPPSTIVTTRHELFSFKACAWPAEPVTLDAESLGDGFGGGSCPGPHPRLLGRNDDCNGGPDSLDALRADGWLSMGAIAQRSAPPGPMAGLLGERESRSILTFAAAEFYGQTGDLWHSDWRARMRPVRADSLVGSLGYLATAIGVLSGSENVSVDSSAITSGIENLSPAAVY